MLDRGGGPDKRAVLRAARRRCRRACAPLRELASECENQKAIGLCNSGLDSVQQSRGLDIILLDGPP